MSKIKIALTLALLLTSTAAFAEGPGAGAQSLSGTCTSSPGYAGVVNECNGPNSTPDLRFQSSGNNYRYSVTLTAPHTHCSRVAYHVMTYDLSRALGTTGLLGPGQSQTINIGSGYAAGLQIARVKVFGWISDSGCNNGTLESWGATAVVNEHGY